LALDTNENVHKSITITTRQTSNIETKTTHEVSLSYMLPKLPRTGFTVQQRYFLEKTQVSRENFKSFRVIGMEQTTNN